MSPPTYTSVIVPVYNNPGDLVESLYALLAPKTPNLEVIVVDDGSTDDTAQVGGRAGARVIELGTNRGAAAARNAGARAARGDVLLFVDADVVVAPDAVGRALRTLSERSEYAAVFGSYDTKPRARGLIAQFRNLLHHYVHQCGSPEASTFWAGLGAVRRDAFDAVGGFDARVYGIEDIELGCRLRSAGYRILLDKGLLCTHLKRWTLPSMIYTDLWMRAVPWSRLMLGGKAAIDDLNVKTAQRVSVALTGLGLVCLALSVMAPGALLLALGAFAVIAVLNRDFYAFLRRERGLGFALASLPLHLVHFSCSGLGYLYAWLGSRVAGAQVESERTRT